MARGAEIIIVLLILYAFGSWAEMKFNPSEWYMATRVVLIFMFQAILIGANRNRGGKE